MKKFSELTKTTDFWLELYKNKLFNEVHNFINENGMSVEEFANKIEKSPEFVRDVLNGNFNGTLEDFLKVSLAVGRYPNLNYSNSAL